MPIALKVPMLEIVLLVWYIDLTLAMISPERIADKRITTIIDSASLTDFPRVTIEPNLSLTSFSAQTLLSLFPFPKISSMNPLLYMRFYL